MKLDVRQRLSIGRLFLWVAGLVLIIGASACGQATESQFGASAAPSASDEAGNNGASKEAGAEGCYLINHDVIITEQSALDEFASMGCLRIAGDLVIRDTDDVSDLSSLDGLRSVSGSLELVDNASLSCAQLPHLEYLGANFVVRANAELRALAARGLETVEASLEVEGNERLEALEVERLTHLGGNLVVTDNPALGQCVADALEAEIETLGGEYRSAGNAEECPRPAVGAGDVGCIT